MNRTDVHSPANFDPAKYSYVGAFDNWPEPGAFLSYDPAREIPTDFGTVTAFNYEHAEYTAGRRYLKAHGAKIHFFDESGNQSCDHCGARCRYIAVYRHENGEAIAVGQTCADQRFGCDNRRDYDVKRLREKAANERERMRAMGAAGKFVEEHCSEMAEWILTPSAETVHPIFLDLARKLIRHGKLSEKQIDFARKLLREHFEKERNGGLTDRQIEIAKEREAAEPAPVGRVEIKGTVIKKPEYRENGFGESLKMVVKDDRGFAVWTTVPSSLELIEDGEFQRGLDKGDRVKMTITLQPSDKDPKFAFGKRPAKAVLLK